MPGSAPRRPKSAPSRVREQKNRVFFARLAREAWMERFFVDVCRFSFCLQSLRTLRSTAHASKNRGSALRGASRVDCAMVPRKISKNAPKIDPKSPIFDEIRSNFDKISSKFDEVRAIFEQFRNSDRIPIEFRSDRGSGSRSGDQGRTVLSRSP